MAIYKRTTEMVDNILSFQAHETNRIMSVVKYNQARWGDKKTLDYIEREWNLMKERQDKIRADWQIIDRFVQNNDETGYINWFRENYGNGWDEWAENFARKEFKKYLENYDRN